MASPLAKELRAHAWPDRESLLLAQRAADELDRLSVRPVISRPSRGLVMPRGEYAQMALEREVDEFLRGDDDFD